MPIRTYSLDRVAAIVLFITLVLSPFFLIPSLSFSVDMSKTLLLVAGIFISFSLYVVSVVKKGEVTLPSTRVLWSVLLIPLAFLTSALLSGNAHISLVGYNLEVGTWAFITLGFVAMFLASVLMRTRERIFYSYLGFLAGFVIMAIIALGKFFFGPGELSLNVLGGTVASPVGTLTDLAVFFGAAAVLSVMALEELASTTRTKWLLALALIVSVFSLAIIGTSTVWIGLLVFSFVYFLYIFSRNASVDAGGERRISYGALVVLIVSLLYVFNPTISASGSHLSDVLSQKFNAVNLSVSPSLSATYQVTRPVIKDSPLLGSGPNTFDVDWTRFKPAAVNNTIFWNAPFAYGIGLLSTFVATTGLLGALLWILFIVFYTLLGMRAIFMRSGDAVSRFLTSSSFVLSLFLWLLSIFYVPSKAMLMLAFTFSGLFIASARAAGAVAEKTIIFRNSSKLAFIAVLLLVAMLVGNIAYAYSAIKQSVAVYDYNKATIAAAAGNVDDARTYAIKAASLSNEDVYLSAVSQIGVARANQILTSTTTDPATARTNFQNALSETIAAAQAATQARPENYANWIALGQLYESLVPAPLSVNGAYDSAKSAYAEAEKRNPNSPEPYYYLARLEVENKNNQGAIDLLNQALAKKNDYADAYYLLTQIQISEGNTDEAIKNAQTLTLLDPTNSGVFFQLGLLKYNKGDWQGAAEALAQALSITPDYANAKYFYGLLVYKLGDKATALAMFQDLLKTNPDNADLAKIIANIGTGKDPLAGIGSSAVTPPISGTTGGAAR